MSAPFVHEFLWRGRSPDDPAPPAWHVVLGQSVALPGQAASLVTTPAMTPEQAEAAGFPLASALAGIDAAALVEADRLRAALATVTAERDVALAEAETARGQAQSAMADAAAARVEVAALERQAALNTTERDALRAQLAEASDAARAV